MLGTLEATGKEGIAVTYLRHLMTTLNGPTKERDLLSIVKESVNNKSSALAFAIALADSASDYAALLNPAHPKWNAYGSATRAHIRTLLDLGVEQIRPLLLAVARHFDIREARKAFKLFVAWSVRFIIAGGRGGLLDRNYGLRAQDVGTGKITTAAGLVSAMADIVPTDASFEATFAEARIPNSRLARYFLRALEQAHAQQSDPEWVPNENEEEINLEHVLPQNPDGTWGEIHPDAAAALFRRIGNMALLKASENTIIGNSLWNVKKPVLMNSGYLLTQDIGNVEEWNEKEIRERQKKLAKLAVTTWPVTVQ